MTIHPYNRLLVVALLAVCSSAVMAQSNDPAPAPSSSTPAVGSATRRMLDEQRNGVNRGEPEAFSAEAAGRAYQKYVDTYKTTTAPGASDSKSATGATGTSSGK